MKCYACGKLVSGRSEDEGLSYQRSDKYQGHISRDCPAPNGGPLNSAGKVCYKCGQAGHISRDCAAAETNGQMSVDGAVEGVPTAAPTAAVA